MSREPSHSVERGQLAEQRAQAFLRRRRLASVATNYRTRGGEIDLIMRDDDTLVFIEVRQRKNSTYGSAAESVTQHKQAKIICAAQAFLVTHRHSGPVRFDVVTFDGDAQSPPLWIKNAFEAAW